VSGCVLAAPQASIASSRDWGNRTPTNGSVPVAGRPLFFRFTGIDGFILPFYVKSEPNGSGHFRPALTATDLQGESIMAKANRTTSTPRRATAAKATKAPSVSKGAIQWGYDKGRLIVVQAPGRSANELPAGRWCLLRDTVTDLQDVANGINSLRAYPAGDVADAMLAVAARGSSLIEDLIENARAFIAMSPKLREAVAKVDAQRTARASSIGGAQ
jgi:hypothetical protein